MGTASRYSTDSAPALRYARMASREPLEIRLVVWFIRFDLSADQVLLAVGNIPTTIARSRARVCTTRGQIGLRRAAKSASC